MRGVWLSGDDAAGGSGWLAVDTLPGDRRAVAIPVVPLSEPPFFAPKDAEEIDHARAPAMSLLKPMTH